MYIVRFSNQNVWIAPWEGDPGRTLKRESAKEFKTEAQAHIFATKVIKANKFRKFSLIVEPK